MIIVFINISVKIITERDNEFTFVSSLLSLFDFTTEVKFVHSKKEETKECKSP